MRYDNIDLAIGDPGAQMALDRTRIVLLDRPRRDPVAGFGDPLCQRITGCVVGQRACVRHREDRDVHRDERSGLVDSCHGSCLLT
jgi:hypothetical protein